jgi:hypothetical protein
LKRGEHLASDLGKPEPVYGGRDGVSMCITVGIPESCWWN